MADNSMTAPTPSPADLLKGTTKGPFNCCPCGHPESMHSKDGCLGAVRAIPECPCFGLHPCHCPNEWGRQTAWPKGKGPGAQDPDLAKRLAEAEALIRDYFVGFDPRSVRDNWEKRAEALLRSEGT